VLHQHANQDVPPPSSRATGVPPQLDALVTWATSRDPSQRPSDAGELHASLIDVRDKLGLHSAVPGLPVTATTPLTQAPPPAVATNAITQAVPVGAASPPDGPTRHRGKVASGGPRFGRKGWIVSGIVVLAIIAAAVLGWYFALGRYTHTPSLLGETKQAADAQLRNAGLHPKWLKPVYSNQYAQNDIAIESPGPGDRITHGGTVSLRLSLGPAHIPAVSGDSVTAATEALRAIDVSVSSVIKQYSDTLGQGLVIKTNKAEGQQVEIGSSVMLFVSKGPKPVVMPNDLIGQSVADAKAELTALGLLENTDRQQFSNTVPAGDVIKTIPAAGATTHAGTIIDLVISKGPRIVAVPDVRGEPLSQAVSDLTAAGFKVDPKEFAPGGPENVYYEEPLQPEPRGTTITIEYY
jgi:serine/threonine-protein kinase